MDKKVHYLPLAKSIVLLTCLLLYFSVVEQTVAETIHQERSIYRDIMVVQNGYRRCLVFNVHRGDRNQTCVEVNDRDRLVFSYTRMSFAGLLLQPQPETILVAGLGGGSIPMTLNNLFPEAKIDVVEIDQAVVNVAKEYFFFEENDNMKVTVKDARVFVKRAALRGKKYDYIVLDAFGGDYIPEHLLTREFLGEVKTIMAVDGVLVANTFSTSRFYDHESVTYQDVFNEFFNFKLPTSGNRIIITQLSSLPPRGELVTRAQNAADRLKKYGVPLLEYPARLSTRVDWDMSRRVLTDQYSPANLLRDN
ncbi:MAG TPA: spermidine synthase [Gammaproteobacteria bacterium]|nr:spermidine synthase [Gammaproteobacteria bacterium]HAT28319.1 spermidine synthase [Gammaproteobacteria bacterium]|tara:strand:- start:561 stop:1481 length:921 start_codon:yes stop_codon:yes gene_type:complete